MDDFNECNTFRTYTLYINGVEKSGISIDGSGVVSGYTLNGTESSIKFVVTDTAGYTDTAELTLTPTATEPEKPESSN